MPNEEERKNRRKTSSTQPSRRTVLKQLGVGATATSGLASVPIDSAAQEAGKVSITGVDPQNFPNITVNYTVDTEAGRTGELPPENSRVIEKLPDRPPQRKPCKGVETGGGSADIVFVFDDSGSMEDEIETMKERVQVLTDDIEAEGIDARYGLVTFTDANRHLEIDARLTDAETLKERVDALQATEGDRFPERNFSAIEMALGLTFRSDAHKVIINITDTISHYQNDKVEKYDSPHTLDDVATKLRERGISYFAVSWDLRNEVPITDQTESGEIIEYDETDIEAGSVRRLAEEANGTWLDMRADDFSEILDELIQDVRTTYKCTYETDAPAQQDDQAGKIGLEVTDPGGRTFEIPPSDEDEAGKLSVPGQVKEPAKCALPSGESAVRDNIAVFRAETGEQLTSQNTDEEGTVNFDIPIEETETVVNVVYYQIYDKDPETLAFEYPLPDEESARVAAEKDGSPDLYTINQIVAAETGGVLDVSLPEAYKLDVEVLDDTGSPESNVRVEVFHRDEETGAWGGFYGFTNRDGLLMIRESDDTGIEVRGTVEVFARNSDTGNVLDSQDLVVDESTSVTLTV